jgi:hypothetical protein
MSVGAESGTCPSCRESPLDARTRHQNAAHDGREKRVRFRRLVG